MKKNILLCLVVFVVLCGCEKESTNNKDSKNDEIEITGIFSVFEGESKSLSNRDTKTTEEPVVIEPKEIFSLLGERYKEYEVIQNNPLIVKVSAKCDELDTNAFSYFSKEGILIQHENKWYEIVLPSFYKNSESVDFGYDYFYANTNTNTFMSIGWTNNYSIDEEDEEFFRNNIIEQNGFGDDLTDCICYEVDEIKMNVKYRSVFDNKGYEVVGYAMLGEYYGIRFSYGEYLNEPTEMPDLESEDFLKSIFCVREYK